MSNDVSGPGGFGSSPFDDFLARISGAGGGQLRPGQRVDITQLMSGPARELLAAAAAQGAQWGDAYLDTEPLLWAASTLEPTRTLLARAGADPDALARTVASHEEHQRSSRTSLPQLTPGAKRALLDAHQISRAMGSNYIGPEHILFALAVNPESTAGQMLAGARLTPEALQAAVLGHGRKPPGQGSRSDTPTLDQFGRDLTALAREGRVD